MKWTVSTALMGVTAVSALSCRKRPHGSQDVILSNVTLDTFGSFNLLSLDDAKAGKLKSPHTGEITQVTGGIDPTFSGGYSTTPLKDSGKGTGPSQSNSTSSYPTSGHGNGSGNGNGHSNSTGSYPTNGQGNGQGNGKGNGKGNGNGSGSGNGSQGGNGSNGGHGSGFGSGSNSTATSPSKGNSTTSTGNNSTSTGSGSQKDTGSCSSAKVRPEWHDLSDSDKKDFVSAIKCLQGKPSAGSAYAPSTSRYEDLVRVHQAMTSSIHGNNIFLVWHRYYLWSFEQILRDECGFAGAFPWWDETLDAGKFASSNLFTASYFGTLPTSKNGQGVCITDGAFANLTCHIGPGTSSSSHCLSRAVDESLTSQSNADFVNTCNSRTTYPEMENCAELGPHAYGHNGVGSVMADVSASPSDPVFFMHHSFVDRNYWAWQNKDDTRISSIDGCTDSNSPCTALTLSTVIDVMGLKPSVTVKDVIDTNNGTLCYEYSY